MLQDLNHRGGFGLGYFYESYQWFETENTVISQLEEEKNILEIWFEVSEEMIHHKRSVYTIYDLLGDLGGLFGMLEIFCQVLLTATTALFGDGLEQYLIGSIFKLETKSYTLDRKKLPKRRPAEFN